LLTSLCPPRFASSPPPRYELQAREPSSPTENFTLSGNRTKLKLRETLDCREKVAACELDYALNCRARMHNAGAPYSPCYPPSRLFPNTYYLTSVDDKFRRTYAVTPDAPLVPADPSAAPVALVPPICLRHEANEQHGVPVTGKLSKLAREVRAFPRRKKRGSLANPPPLPQDSRIDVKISSVITGVAVGLPGSSDVFSSDNLGKLIDGTNAITPISGSAKVRDRGGRAKQHTRVGVR
jgi:hypothetical protein